MKYIVILKSELNNGMTYWYGGIEPLRPLAKNHPMGIVLTESIPTPNKNRITKEIERKLLSKNFITDVIMYQDIRVGSIQELLEYIALV